MSDEFSNAAPLRLDARPRPAGWLEPLRTAASIQEPTPFDEEIAEADERLARVVAECEHAREAVFAARDALQAATYNGGREAAAAAVAEARRAWEAAEVEEGRARVRRVSLGAIRADWRRERELERSGDR